MFSCLFVFIYLLRTHVPTEFDVYGHMGSGSIKIFFKGFLCIVFYYLRAVITGI